LGPGALAPYLKKQFGGPCIVNENFTLESAEAAIAAGDADAVAFGKLFIANPDLPDRFRRHAPLNEPKPETFYAQGPEGYIDYPKLADA
jgi:2,4-dienoyl-CoA reductase-like NADH-dependent reductase (Old Yellow Enzyme family)